MGEEVDASHMTKIRIIEFSIVLVFFILMFFISSSVFHFGPLSKLTGYDVLPSGSGGGVGGYGEACDGIDNNEDGVVDEGCGCVGVHADDFCGQFSVDSSSNLAEHPGAVDSCIANGCVAYERWCFGADINKDGVVNMTDYDIIDSRVHDNDCSVSNSWCNGTDLNLDGFVGYDERAFVGSSLEQENCGTPRRISVGCSFESSCNGITKDSCSSNPACMWDKIDLGSCGDVFLNATWNETSGLNASGAFDFVGDSKVPNAANYMNITQINGDYAMGARGDLGVHRYERAVSKIFNPPKSSWGGRVYVNFNQSLINPSTTDIVFAGAYNSALGWYDYDWTRYFALAITRNSGINKTSFLYSAGYHGINIPFTGLGTQLFSEEEDLPNRWVEVDWMFSNNRLYSRIDDNGWEPATIEYPPSGQFNFSRFSLGWISSYSGGWVYFKSVELYNDTCAFDWMRYNSSSMPIICVDNDNDRYNSTGLTCGLIDCNDSDSNIRYSLSGNCSVVDPSDVDNDGYVSVEYGGGDCNDSNSKVHPGAVEICDGKDNDCNGVVDNLTSSVGCLFYGICSGSHKTCTNGVWSECSKLPQGEICDSIDQDCDGMRWFFNSSIVSCPLGYKGGCSPELKEICLSNTTNIVDFCPSGLNSECNNLDDCSEAECINNICVYTKIENLSECYHCVKSSAYCTDDGICRGVDVDHNGLVDKFDTYVLFGAYYGRRDCDISNFFCGYSDINVDGWASLSDYNIMKTFNGSSCKVRSWELCSLNPEVCNSIDDNCNGLVDEGNVCGTNSIIVSGGGGSGGGGGPIVNVIVLNETELSSGAENDFGVGDVVMFDISDSQDVEEPHSLSITHVDESEGSAEILIQSTPQNAKLIVGDPQKFELDGDGYYDVRVTLNSIISSRAIISVKKIAENIVTGEGPVSHVDEPPKGASDVETLTRGKYFWVVMISSILMALAIIVWTLRKISEYRTNLDIYQK